MRTVGQIEEDVFSLTPMTTDNDMADLAFLSLGIALRAYFASYRAVRGRLSSFVDASPIRMYKDVFTEEDVAVSADEMYPSAFVVSSAETVIHLQHFFELIYKDILRRVHPVLVAEAADNPAVLYKLLSGQQLRAEEDYSVKTTDAAKAFARLEAVIGAGGLQLSVYKFFIDNRAALIALTRLRNRIWHRGAHVLRYRALDDLVSGHLLPIVVAISRLPEYTGNLWRPRDLFCRIDPIASLIDEAGRPAPNYYTLAAIKEFGRASFENPLLGPFAVPGAPERSEPNSRDDLLEKRDRKYRVRAVHVAGHEAATEGASLVDACPVCSVKTLVARHDVDVQDYDPEEQTATFVPFVSEVNCTCCTFNVDMELGTALPALQAYF